MVEVTSSSSSGGSLSAQSTGDTLKYDLNSWQGLTEVLQAARAAGLDNGAYSSFRDKVLEYAQSGGDAELKKKILDTVASFREAAQQLKEDDLSAEGDLGNGIESAEHKKKKKRKRKKKQKDRSKGGDDKMRPENKPTPSGLGMHSRPTPVFSVIETSGQPVEKRDVTDGVHVKDQGAVPRKSTTDAAVPGNLPTGSGLPKFVDPQNAAEPQLSKPARAYEDKNGQSAPASTPHASVPLDAPVESGFSPPPVKDEPQVAQKQEQARPPAPASPPSASANTQTSPKVQQSAKDLPVPEEKSEPKMKTVTELQASSQKVEAHKARIAEIKHEVNTTIGNPVALIDNGNEIGRQYMNALLEAMKATSGGPAGSLDLAMAKLEKAYELMKKSIDDSALEKPAPAAPEVPPPVKAEITPGPSPSPVESAKPKEASEEKNHTTTPQSETPSLSDEPEEVSVSQTPVAPEIPPPPVRPHSGPQKSGIPSLADLQDVTERVQKRMANAAAETPLTPAPTPVQKTESQAKKEEAQRQPNDGPAKVKGEKSAAAPPTSVNTKGENATQAGVPKVHPEVVPSETVMARSPNQSAISSPEVTSALNELLSEWKIFKGSGFLGMGPSGPESPLYQQLKNLSMFAVLAGRWENSTADVKQAIKDYVNAWRHEQGITYTPSETFEHYLRRVVLRILERQKQ